MFESWQDIQKKKRNRKLLLDFYFEVAKNWESWHVMHQRNVLDKFRVQKWQEVRGPLNFLSDDIYAKYIQSLEAYNQTMDDYKNYETWYASDVNHKTTESAKVLHGKRELAGEKFTPLLALIEPVKKNLEEQLIQQKIVKRKVGFLWVP